MGGRAREAPKRARFPVFRAFTGLADSECVQARGVQFPSLQTFN